MNEFLRHALVLALTQTHSDVFDTWIADQLDGFLDRISKAPDVISALVVFSEGRGYFQSLHDAYLLAFTANPDVWLFTADKLKSTQRMLQQELDLVLREATEPEGEEVGGRH